MSTANTPLRPLALAVLRSYSLIFFSQHRGFAALLLLLSFANPGAGAAGLAATLLAVGGAWLLGFDREVLKTGAYSFNALLVGLALGTFYEPGWAYGLVLLVGALLALLLTVALGGWLAPRGLPPLSLPFLGVIWLLTPAAEQFHALLDVFRDYLRLFGCRDLHISRAVVEADRHGHYIVNFRDCLGNRPVIRH